MAPLFFFLLLAVPIIEIYVLIKVGALIGAIPTIALVVFSAVLGTLLLRWQGLGLVQRVRYSLAQGAPPATEMLEGIVVLISGALLLAPGFLTDVIGLLFLVPAFRRRVVLWFLARQGVVRASGRSRPGGPRRPHTIEGEFRKEKGESDKFR